MSLTRSLSRFLTFPLTRNLNGADEAIFYGLTSALPSGSTYVRANNETSFNASGVVATATANNPSFNHDPLTLTPLGLLLRDRASKNELLWSNRIDNAAWGKYKATASVSTTALDGTSNAYKLQEDSSNDAHVIFQTFTTATATTEGTILVRAKMAGRRYLQLLVYRQNSPFGNRWQTFDLQTGTLGTTGTTASAITLTSALIRDVGNGYFECIMQVNAGSRTDLGVQLALSNSNSASYAPAYQGDGTSGVWIDYAGFYQGAENGVIVTGAATASSSVPSFSLPLADGIWDITVTDTTGARTSRVSVVGGYPVTPRSGQIHVTSVRAALVATYAGFDADAKTWLHSNQLVDLTGRRAVDATYKAIKAASTLTFADIAFAGLAPGRNKDTGTTIKTAGGWTAAQVDGTLSSSSLMRTGDPYGLYTNNGETSVTMTRIAFSAVPLGTTYAVGVIASPKGNSTSSRGLFAVGFNDGSLKQTGSRGLVLNADNTSVLVRGLRIGRANRLSLIQEASSVGRAIGEIGYNRTTSFNRTGTNTVYIGSNYIELASENTGSGGPTEMILEACYWLKNPSEVKVEALTTILRDTLCVVPSGAIEGFILTGQSQASPTACQMLDRILATDSDYGRNFLNEVFQYVNQPLAQWVGASPPYARATYYNNDLLPSGGNWQTVLGYEDRPARTSGLYLFQGEADAGYGQGLADGPAEAVAALYEAKLQAFVDFIREDYTNLPIVIFQVDWETVASHTLTASETARIATIRAAQAAVAAANANITLVDTRGMARDPADGVHLTNAGILAAMQAGWAAMKALL